LQKKKKEKKEKRNLYSFSFCIKNEIKPPNIIEMLCLIGTQRMLWIMNGKERFRCIYTKTRKWKQQLKGSLAEPRHSTITR